MNHLNGEIYTPGYLFNANGAAAVRPIIQQAPPDLSPGQTFTVRVDNPANIRTLALMPFGSTTHAFNTTARRIELPFSVQADGSLSVTLPVNSNVIPPGDWMLFAIGNNGTPSVASTIHVNPYLSISNTIGTDTGSTATITSGGMTKDNTLGLSGTVSDAGGFSSVQIYDGATLLGPATISSGNWSYTTAALLDGSHSFTAKATDNAGNTTTTSAVTATVNTGTAVSLFSASNTPAQASVNDGAGPEEFGVKFTSSSAGQITALKFYRSASDTGTDLVDLWSSTGTKLASATFTNTTASGWQTVNLAQPVPISANTTYVASYHTNGAYVATDNFFTSALTSGQLTAPSSASVSGGNGVYSFGGTSSTGIFPTSTWNASNYYADVVFTSSTGGTDRPPVAVNDSGFTTTQNTALNILGSTLLANDSDPDGDPLTITGVSGGVNGTASFNAQNNTATFTPTTGYTGPASFTYAISDGRGGTASASVSLTVNTSSSTTASLFSSSATPAAEVSMTARGLRNLG